MARVAFAAGLLFAGASIAVASHDRVSLDRRIRLSDLIVVGTVTAIDSAAAPGGALDLAETASKVATIEVESVLKGRLENRQITVGFQTEYEDEDAARVSRVAVSSDGRWIAAAGGGGLLRVWDAGTGAAKDLFLGHEDGVTCVAFSPDGAKLLSGDGDVVGGGDLKLWDPASGAELQKLETARGVRDAVFTPAGDGVLAGGNGRVFLWTLPSGETSLIHDGYIPHGRRVAISPDATLIAWGGPGDITVWDARAREKRLTLGKFKDYVSCVAFSPDGSRIAACGGGYMSVGQVKVWSVDDGQEVLSVQIQEDCTNSLSCQLSTVAFSPDGKLIVTAGGSDNAVKLWDAVTGEHVRTFLGHTGWVSSVAFTSDSDHLVSGSHDKTIAIWDTNGNERPRVFQARPTFVEGERYVLFLRRTSRPFFATVNWQHGVLRVVSGQVHDPRWPSDTVSRLYRSNEHWGPFDPQLPSTFRQQVPLEQALAIIRDAVKLADAQVELGEADIDFSLAPVLFDSDGALHRVRVRLPQVLACPPFDSDRLDARLITRGGPVEPVGAASVGEAPVSVDPLGVTLEATFTFPANRTVEDVLGVGLLLDGAETRLCLREINPGECKPDVARTRCQACGSDDVQPIWYGLFDPPSDPCALARPWRGWAGGCVVGDQEWHCDVCGLEW